MERSASLRTPRAGDRTKNGALRRRFHFDVRTGRQCAVRFEAASSSTSMLAASGRTLAASSHSIGSGIRVSARASTDGHRPGDRCREIQRTGRDGEERMPDQQRDEEQRRDERRGDARRVIRLVPWEAASARPVTPASIHSATSDHLFNVMPAPVAGMNVLLNEIIDEMTP